MVRMDRLLDAWRADPRVDATVELCAMLIRAALKAGAAKILPDDFVIGFAMEARAKHPKNIDVAIAVCDLFLATSLINNANAVLDLAAQFAPNDNRLKERMEKLGKRRRTQEFAAKTPDPETLDAPTTPLDPPTEPAGRGPPPPLPAPGPRRQPTTIGLPAAPPPLPAPPKVDRSSKVALTERGPAPSEVAKPPKVATDEGVRDDETTRTESGLPPALFGKPEPRKRQQTVAFGSPVEDEGPITKVTSEEPRTGVRDLDDGPATSVNVSDEGPATSVTGVRSDDPPTSVSALSVADEGPATAVTSVQVEVPPPVAAAAAAAPPPELASPLPPQAPARPQPDDDDDPKTAMTRVAETPEHLRQSSAEGQPAPRPARTLASAADQAAAAAHLAEERGQESPAGPRVAARRAAVRRPGASDRGRAPGGLPPLEGEQEIPTKVGDTPQVLAAQTTRGPAVGATPAPRAATAGEQQRERFRADPTDSSTVDDDDGSVTSVQDLLPKAPLARPPGRPAPAVKGLPPPPPSDPETETKTAVRSHPPPPQRSVAPPIPIATLDDPRSAISQVSQAVTNQWRPPPPPPPAPPAPPVVGPSPSAWPAPAQVVEEPSGVIEDDSDDEEGAVTGLREVPPLAPRPIAPLPPPPPRPVVKGGTFAMNQPGPPPAQFPATPPRAAHDEDDSPRTHVLSAREALIASQVDPRPPHSRAPSHAPAPSQPGYGVVQRGLLVGGGAQLAGAVQAYPQHATDLSLAPSGPITFGAPPSVRAPELPVLEAPTFGPRPVMPATPAPVSLEPYAQAQPPPSGFIDPQSFQPGSVPAYPSERAPVAPPQLAADSFRGQPDPLSQSGARPARPYQLYAALVIAVVAVAGLVGYATYLLLSDRAPTASTDARLPDELEATLLRGTPTDLAKADTELRKLEATPTVAVALGRLRHRALAGLEVTGVAAPIDEAVAAARKQGASSEDTAFGELASAVLAGDRARADAVVTANPDARDKSAMFALFEGALLELAGDPAAAARYEKALELDARLIVARVRHARLLLLRAEIEAGEAQLALVPEDHPARAALSALAWARNSLAGKSSPAPKLTSTSADLPRCLHPVFTVLSVMATPVDSKKRDVDPRLKQAVADADGPASSLFFGELAFSRGDAITAVSAAQKTLASAPNLVGAIELLTRVALASGKFEPLEQAVGPLPSEVSRPVLAFIAYERGDVEKLASLARGLSDQDDPGGVVRTRLALLRGAAPVPVDAVERLRGADKVAGDLCAADAAIDAGDLTRAHVVVDKWTDSPPFPARALRRARLLRHEGKFTEAERMLEQAPSLASTQIERILVEAEIAQSRDHALSLIDDRIGAAGPFLEAYVLARKGERDKAERRLAAAKTPGPDAPLSLRVAAALAYAELGGADGGAAFVQVLAEKFPQNRDVKRAAAKLSPAEDPKPEPKRKRR